MTHTVMIEEIPVYIQIQGTEMNDYLDRKIHKMISNLKGHAKDIKEIRLYISDTLEPVKSPRKFIAEVKIPGLDFVASDSGRLWKGLLSHVEKRLIRQLQRRTELLKRQAIINAAALAAQGIRA
jgi:hypothetical protein